MSAFLLSQILATIAFGLGLASSQFRQRRSILLCLVLGTAFNASHFLLLQRPGPAALMVLIGTRYLSSLLTTRRWVMYLFLALSATAFVTTYQSPVSLLALLAVCFGTWGTFHPDDRVLRRFIILGNSCWLLHNLLVWTPVGVVMEASFLSSNLIGYWRFYGPRAHQPG
jgi:hypothetical protein